MTTASAAITGAPTVYGGKVFVRVQGLNEEGTGRPRRHECCTFRGSLSALDANTGPVLWKTYTIDEPKPRGKNADGVRCIGVRQAAASGRRRPIDAKRRHGLRRHRQRLRRSAAADDRRRASRST